MAERPRFGTRLPRPRRAQPVPLHQTRLDSLLARHPDALAHRFTRTGRPVVLLPGGGTPDVPVAARLERVA